jgi:hypothetical protein
MVTVGLFVPLKAKPGKEAEVESFLESGRALADEEPQTTAWFALRMGSGTTRSSTSSPTRKGAWRT